MKNTNTIKNYKTLTKACSAVGFEVQIPPRFKLIEINVIDNKILELRFSSVIVRKTKYDKGSVLGENVLDAFPGAYVNNCNKVEFDDEQIRGIGYWNGSTKSPKEYLAIWNDKAKKYSYSVYAPKGIKLKSMSTWQKKFK